MTCTCPASHTTGTLIPNGTCLDRNRKRQPGTAFLFAGETCTACPLRPQCFRAKTQRGRTVQLHPQEELLQQARAFQHSPEFLPYRQARQTVEHRQGAAGAAGDPPGALLWPKKDYLPAAAYGNRGQFDPDRLPDRANGPQRQVRFFFFSYPELANRAFGPTISLP